MKIRRKDTAQTRQRLLEAAGKIFADKGYRDATIADICTQARTNVAAVNYHFGDKESLYVEAWRYAFRESMKNHPPDGGVPDDASPEKRLHGRVTALLQRIADPNERELSILHKEMTTPTGLLEEVMREEIQPLHEQVNALAREVLGPDASDRQVDFCEISIISQCNNVMVKRMLRKGKQDGMGIPVRIDDIKDYAEHVVRLSLAGMRALREETARKAGQVKSRRARK